MPGEQFSVHNGRKISMEEMPHHTWLPWQPHRHEGGGAAALMASPSYCIDSTHTHTHICTHRSNYFSFFLRAHTESFRRSTLGIIPSLHLSTPSPRREPHAASDRIVGQANYSRAHMYAPSSHIHRHPRRKQKIVWNAVYA